MFRTPLALSVAFCSTLIPPSLQAHDAKATVEEPCCQLDLWTGEGATIGHIFFPEINYQASAGSSTTDPERLAVGHHDPNRHGITQQNIEFSLGVQLGKNIRLFGNYNALVDHDDHWTAEFEEHYAVISLPYEITLRGGRFFTHMGYHNLEHLHDFTFVDKYLANGRLIGEDSAAIYGGEISTPVFGRVMSKGWSDLLAVSYGAVPDPEEEGEHHEEIEAPFEAEGALWQDWLATADYSIRYSPSEAVLVELGVSGAWGRNNFGRHTQVYGLHFQQLWRPAGAAEADACCHKDSEEFLRWRTEAFVRRFGAVSGGHEGEHEEEEVGGEEEHGKEPTTLRDEFTDFGVYTVLSYGFKNGKVQAHLRGEYVSGVREAGLLERYRISPAITWHPSDRLPIHFKVQYNYDHIPQHGNEHSVWAQFSLTWGDCCGHEKR